MGRRVVVLSTSLVLALAGTADGAERRPTARVASPSLAEVVERGRIAVRVDRPARQRVRL